MAEQTASLEKRHAFLISPKFSPTFGSRLIPCIRPIVVGSAQCVSLELIVIMTFDCWASRNKNAVTQGGSGDGGAATREIPAATLLQTWFRPSRQSGPECLCFRGKNKQTRQRQRYLTRDFFLWYYKPGAEGAEKIAFLDDKK